MFVSAPALLHIDMDAFFASVEQVRRPELRGRPIVVGGEVAKRSVVSTCSYEARACGVRTAMPVTQAQRLCPKAVFLPVDMAAYVAVSKCLVALYRQFTDLVEVVSIDEAFLNVAGSRRLFGPPQAIARRIQERVYSEHGLTCSIGIGPNKLLAKLASELSKPGGLGVLSGVDVHGRLRELPVRELWGIGPVAEKQLTVLGLTTVGALQDCTSRRPLRPPSAAAPMRSNSSPSAVVCRRSPYRAAAQVGRPRGHLQVASARSPGLARVAGDSESPRRCGLSAASSSACYGVSAREQVCWAP